MNLKKCGKCKVEKPLSEFYVRRSGNAPQGRCKECAKLSVVEWDKKNPEKLKARQKRYAFKHRIKKAAQTAKWYAKNKLRNHANTAAWYKKHPEAGNAKAAKYKARKQRAIPAWANEFFISEAYDLAKLRTKAFGYKWSVDHIVPLKSKIVCGLHVENNLRVIPASMNSIKGNRVWPDMP